MLIVKGGQVKPVLEYLPIQKAANHYNLKRDKCEALMKSHPHMTDVEVSICLSYNLQSVEICRGRIAARKAAGFA